MGHIKTQVENDVDGAGRPYRRYTWSREGSSVRVVAAVHVGRDGGSVMVQEAQRVLVDPTAIRREDDGLVKTLIEQYLGGKE